MKSVHIGEKQDQKAEDAHQIDEVLFNHAERIITHTASSTSTEMFYKPHAPLAASWQLTVRTTCTAAINWGMICHVH